MTVSGPRFVPTWAPRVAGISAFPLAVALAASVWSYTVDDAYISLRYARNLAHGLGLVYNPGEWVEGYTNFLWTVLLAIPHAAGWDPVLFAKVLGLGAVLAAVEASRRLEARLAGRPVGIAPLLLASSVPFVGHGVFGLETALYAALVAWAMLWTDREENRDLAWPHGSAGLWAAAALCRPDAPLWIGFALLRIPARPLAPRNLRRAAMIAAPVGAIVAFRLAAYGHPVPNTLAAKTGDLAVQIAAGFWYLSGYAAYLGPIALLVTVGLVLSLIARDRLGRALVLSVVAWWGYVLVVGGDWMVAWRFCAPAEPLAFALAGAGVAAVGSRTRSRAAIAFVALLLSAAAVHRVRAGRDLVRRVEVEEKNWEEMLDAPIAFLQQAPSGEVAFADLGYVGYATDRPIFDLLGLMAPSIARLEGGYTRKNGRGLAEAVVARAPTYVFLLSLGGDCHHPIHDGMRALYEQPDRLLQRHYVLAARVSWYGDMVGCFFERGQVAAAGRTRELFAFDAPDALATWTLEGHGASIVSVTDPVGRRVHGAAGGGFLSTFDPRRGDEPRGRAISPPFSLDRDVLSLRVGGGFVAGLAVDLVVDGTRVWTVRGRNTEALDAVSFDVRPWRGASARLVVTDDAGGPWGHVLLDAVTLFDVPGLPPPPPRGSFDAP